MLVALRRKVCNVKCASMQHTLTVHIHLRDFALNRSTIMRISGTHAWLRSSGQVPKIRNSRHYGTYCSCGEVCIFGSSSRGAPVFENRLRRALLLQHHASDHQTRSDAEIGWKPHLEGIVYQ